VPKVGSLPIEWKGLWNTKSTLEMTKFREETYTLPSESRRHAEEEYLEEYKEEMQIQEKMTC